MARHRSLTRAGIELGISEAAVSQRIKALEAPHQVPEPYDPGRRVYCFDPDGHELERHRALERVIAPRSESGSVRTSM